MADREIELSKTGEIDTNTNIDINILIEDKQDKSTFERAIIEAFKQTNPEECIIKLSIALDEIKYYIEEVKSSQGAKHLLNKNLIDKLSRIIERKQFNVNIQISKIYDHLLESSNFPLFSSNQELLISFSNEILNMVDIIKSTNVSKSLEKKCCSFLNYLLNDSKSDFDDEQKEIIQELLYSFPSRNNSVTFKNFQQISDQILALCKSRSFEDKLEGMLLLMDSFCETNSLDEQYDLLFEYCPQIIKVTIYQPNPEYRQVYYQLGNFIISLLFTFKYQIEALVPNGQGDNNKQSKQKAKTFFLIDSSLPHAKIDSNTEMDLLFLNESVYELASQKEALMKCENIIAICSLIVNTLSIFDKMFELQYVCYLILKKIYFSFSKFRSTIEDSLACTLINLCMFKDQKERFNSIECRQFLHYLLNCEGEESLKEKIQHRIKAKEPNEINTQLEEGIQCHLSAVEYDRLNVSDFNLRIGYPSLYLINAGAQYDSYIEVEEANSLVYISFFTSSHDITFCLLKYTSRNEEGVANEGHFAEVFKLEKVICTDYSIKIVLFVCSPGIYKLIYDNTYSWITAKTIKHRLSVLKPISPINIPSYLIASSINKRGDTINASIINEARIEKSMVIKHEERTRNIDFASIQQQQGLVLKDQSTTLHLPVILAKNSIRLANWKRDKVGNITLHYTELLTKDTGIMNLDSFESSIEAYLKGEGYLDTDNGFSPIKTIYLNAFINEKTIAELNTIPMSNEDHIRSSIIKIGFYPGNLLSKYPRINYSCSKICDSCIMNIILEKIMKEKKINSLIHIHFDRKGAFSSLFTEGVIQDTVKGFFYDNGKAMTENIDNVIEFINKTIVYFGVFELSVSQSDIDVGVFNSCCKFIEASISKSETKISFTVLNQGFIEKVFKCNSLFF